MFVIYVDCIRFTKDNSRADKLISSWSLPITSWYKSVPFFATLDFISFICPTLPEGSIRCSIDAGLDCKSYSLSPGATEISKSE